MLRSSPSHGPVLAQGFKVAYIAVGNSPRPAVALEGLHEAALGQFKGAVVGNERFHTCDCMDIAVNAKAGGERHAGFGMVGTAVTSIAAWTVEPQRTHSPWLSSAASKSV